MWEDILLELLIELEHTDGVIGSKSSCFSTGGHGTFSNIVNNLVHIIMYSYYMMAAMGPQYQKYLWWKKHLTTLQLVSTFDFYAHAILMMFKIV